MSLQTSYKIIYTVALMHGSSENGSILTWHRK